MHVPRTHWVRPRNPIRNKNDPGPGPALELPEPRGFRDRKQSIGVECPKACGGGSHKLSALRAPPRAALFSHPPFLSLTVCNRNQHTSKSALPAWIRNRSQLSQKIRTLWWLGSLAQRCRFGGAVETTGPKGGTFPGGGGGIPRATMPQGMAGT